APVAPAGTTIGGVVAGGDAGPWRAGHGTPRDMLLGVELATGDGRLLRFGGRVVKNVAGYDGVRLAAGSRGRIGVITRLYLRVRGAPRVDRTLAVACGPGADGRRRAADLALGLRAAVSADSLEVRSPAVEDALSGKQRGGTGWLVGVRMLGGEAAVAESQARAEQVARAVGGTAQVPALIWDALARLEGS